MCALELARRDFAQQPKGLGPLARRERPNHQARSLFCDRLGHRRMSMAEAGDRDAGKKIDVGIAVGIGQGGAVAVFEGDSRQQRDPLAARRDIALLVGEDLARFGPGYVSYDLR